MKKVNLAALAVAVALATPAFAQSADEEIIVTAQRREQNPQDVGVAISVLSGQTLIERGVTNVNGLENITPSLEVESQFGGGQPSFRLRGVGFKDYATLNSPTVGVYVDEVAYTFPIMTQGVLYDVSRVEVLRGPQGTLYGRNTTGGAINIISNRPTQEFAYGATFEYSNWDRAALEGYVSGPLGGGAAARLSLAAAQGGAWQRNRETGAELGEEDKIALRGQLLFPATDNLELLINVHGFTDQSDGLGLQVFKPNIVGVAPHVGQRSTSWGHTDAEFTANTGVAFDRAPFRDNDGLGGSINASYDFGASTLTYILGRETLNRREYNDWDASPLSIAEVYFTSDADVTSHELRLASDGDNVFDWIVGVYHADEDLNEVYQSEFGFAVRTSYQQEVATTAVFGQAEWQVSDRLNLIGGLRYEDEERDLKNLGTFAAALGFATLNAATCTTPLTPATCTTALVNRSQSMQELTGKIGLEFDLSDDALLYASVSRGVKSGGFTAYNTLAPAAADPFRPEELWAYEAGFKSDFGPRLRVNGSAFYYDYTDQQVQGAIFVAGFVIGQIQNVPKSEIYGAELELTWNPIDALTIQQSVGYAHGEFEEGQILDTNAPPALRNLSGERIGFPEWTYSGAVTYDGALGANWGWSAGIDYSYRSDTDPPLLKPASGEGYGVDAYWLVNANLAIRPNDGPWEFALFGRNILDEDYQETRNFFAGVDITPIAARGMPATYGVRVSYHR